MSSSGVREPSVIKNTNLAASTRTLADHVCLFLDCQTTGASVASGGSLLEVAWCDGASKEILSKVQSYLVKQPEDGLIPPRIQMLTGITDDDMVNAVESQEILTWLLEKSQHVSQPQLCIMHYARFETHFLMHLVQKHGDGREWPFQNICTFEIARRLYPNLPSRGIRALGGFIGLDMEEVKRSNSHVEATRVIWGHLVEKLAENGIETLEHLQDFLATKAGARSGPLEYKLDRMIRLELPSCPGVYRMRNSSGRILYVGKATSLKSRVNSHFRGRKRKTSKSKELLTQVASIDVTECGSPLEAALLETDEIKLYDPPYNISLKQRNRKILFASWDFLSFSHEQDEDHVIGPLPNVRALDALLRLSVTINSGVVDPELLFVEIPVETLSEGVVIFMERHGITMEEGIAPRDLLALGMSLFRRTRWMLRHVAIEQAKRAAEAAAAEAAADVGEPASAEAAAAETNDDPDSACDADEDLEDEDFDFDGEDLTPEEVAEKFESLLMGVARTYLASKELTALLNSNISFSYKRAKRDLFIRNGQVSRATTDDDKRFIDLCDEAARPWSGLDVRDYDRMRVLLTELTIMHNAKKDLIVEPPLTFLSRW